MFQTDFMIWCSVLTVILVGPAMVTDLRSRRIPNFLTFPAFFAALIARTAIQGWSGLGVALIGAALAPLLLLLLHGGRGLGMGDLKLAVALGAIAGPVMAATMILLSAVVGGIQAIVVMSTSGGILSQLVSTLFIGFSFGKSKKNDSQKDTIKVEKSRKALTMPYGVAMGIGSLLTLAVCWWTGQENWILELAKIAANQ